MKNYETPTTSDLRAHFCRIYPQQPGREPGPRSMEENNKWRMDRALSWLEHADECNPENNPDEKFLCLWISFNSAYGDDENLKPDSWLKKISDHKKIENFLRAVVKRDAGGRLADLIRAHKNQFDEIITNRFLFQPFWKAAYIRNAWIRWSNPSSEFTSNNLLVENALAGIMQNNPRTPQSEKQTTIVLQHTFDRLYTLRNQVFHGGAAYRDGYNRSSFPPANIVLGACVSEFLKIMLEKMETQKDMDDWGMVAYPPFLKKPDDETDKNPPQRF
ncbi:MAG: HEPN domain-containing protein [Gammaproteobacteria bacterium]|nr:HEPN domain-containing protein [Gammaproteobacteria bacterium]